MYEVVLVFHSTWRWVVIATGVTLLVVAARRRAPADSWSARADRLRRTFLFVLDLQVLLGVVLYVFLSPLPRVAWADPGSALGDPVLRYYFIEHAFGMLLAVSVAHVGLARAGKGPMAGRGRPILWTQVAWLLVTLASVPWRGLAYGRPLLRW